MRIVVSGQGEQPDSIGVVNAVHRLLAPGADENGAGLAFVDLLFGIAKKLWPVMHGAKGSGAFGSHGGDCTPGVFTGFEGFFAR